MSGAQLTIPPVDFSSQNHYGSWAKGPEEMFIPSPHWGKKGKRNNNSRIKRCKVHFALLAYILRGSKSIFPHWDVLFSLNQLPNFMSRLETLSLPSISQPFHLDSPLLSILMSHSLKSLPDIPELD